DLLARAPRVRHLHSQYPVASRAGQREVRAVDVIGILERLEREVRRHPVAAAQRDALVEAEEAQAERAFAGDLDPLTFGRGGPHLDVRVPDLVAVEDDSGPVLV